MSFSNTRIRLLFYHPTYTFGGAEKFAYYLLKGIDKSKFSITLVTSKEIAKSFETIYLEKILFIEELGLDVWFREVTKDSIKRFIKDITITARLLKDESPQIAFGMMYYASSLLALAKTLYRIDVRVISSPRGPMTPYLNVFHPKQDINRFFWRLNFYALSVFSQGIVVAASGTKQDCIERYFANPKKLVVINNAVDINEIKTLASEYVDTDGLCVVPLIVAAGRLCYEKNFSLLLQAFQRVREKISCRLLIIGDGAERKALENISKKLGVQENILFVGYQKNPYRFMKYGKLFIHTCMLEGFGNVILEAMALGLPVIATDCPYGPREIIEHNKNGFLVPIDDKETLAEAIVSLLKNNERFEKMSEAAMQRAAEFSVKRMVKAYESYFFSLLDKM